MNSESDHASDEQSPTGGRNGSISIVEKVVQALRNSFFLSLAALGIVLLALATYRQDGALAGMLGVWGATTVGLGFFVYTTLWYLRDY